MALPHVQLAGNIASDPELRYTPQGHAVVTFSVACNKRRWDQQQNQWVDDSVTFLRCEAWGNLATNTADTIAKGMPVVITGTLRQDNWETKNATIGPNLAYTVANVHRATTNNNAGQQTHTRNQSPTGGFGQQDACNSQPQNTGGFAQSDNEEPPF